MKHIVIVVQENKVYHCYTDFEGDVELLVESTHAGEGWVSVPEYQTFPAEFSPARVARHYSTRDQWGH